MVSETQRQRLSCKRQTEESCPPRKPFDFGTQPLPYFGDCVQHSWDLTACSTTPRWSQEYVRRMKFWTHFVQSNQITKNAGEVYTACPVSKFKATPSVMYKLGLELLMFLCPYTSQITVQRHVTKKKCPFIVNSFFQEVEEREMVFVSLDYVAFVRSNKNLFKVRALDL